ncbi:MAG: calcium-binding protein [Syntrophothermus sp.]
MKKTIPILISLLVGCAATGAQAGERPLTLLLAGDPKANVFSIGLSSDGRSYVVSSNAPLEAGGSVCSHPEGDPSRLQCDAAAIGSFEVTGGGGPDRVVIASELAAPATLRGGAGDDKLVGGAGNDLLVGGAGADTLIGRAGGDWLVGGAGNDRLVGGAGDDRLVGGPGENVLAGGSGSNEVS